MPIEQDPAAVAAVQQAFRLEYGRTVAVLLRTSSDLGQVEDAVQEAFEAAAAHWPTDGVPPNPQAWLVTTARRRLVDRFRRESTVVRHAQHLSLPATSAHSPGELDDELRLVLLCAHPALSPQSQLVLTLRFVAGLTVDEIARAVGQPVTTVAQRLSRAKAKIRDARIPFGSAEPEPAPERLDVARAVVYAVFNEGYLTTSGPMLRDDLTAEAIHLARNLVRLVPRDPETRGLLALLLLLQARREARQSGGALVTLPNQDRSQWDRSLVAEGHALVRECLAVNRPGPYQLQAALQAVHCDAESDEQVDWLQILALYDQLLAVQPSSAARLARVVALGKVAGAGVALAELDRIDPPTHASDLAGDDHYTLAVRAHLLAELGEAEQARVAYTRAARATTSPAERAHLEELSRGF